MIKGVHTMFYTSEPEAMREFLRDKPELPFTDIGHGWMIFDVPEADIGCHPADETGERGKAAGTHDISFYVDDIQQTVADLERKGVTCEGGIQDMGWGQATRLPLPGGVAVWLYQPSYDK